MKPRKKSFRRNLKDLDKPLLIITVGLFIFGLLNIVTASSSESVTRYNTSIYYWLEVIRVVVEIGLIFLALLFNQVNLLNRLLSFV